MNIDMPSLCLWFERFVHSMSDAFEKDASRKLPNVAHILCVANCDSSQKHEVSDDIIRAEESVERNVVYIRNLIFQCKLIFRSSEPRNGTFKTISYHTALLPAHCTLEKCYITVCTHVERRSAVNKTRFHRHLFLLLSTPSDLFVHDLGPLATTYVGGRTDGCECSEY
jgi:hypothetical protein